MTRSKRISLFICLSLIALLFLASLSVNISLIFTLPTVEDIFDICDQIDPANYFECNSGEDLIEYALPFVTEYGASQNMSTFKVSASNRSLVLSFRGLSLSGGEIRALSNGKEAGYFMPHISETQPFVDNGMNSFRVPIRWEYIATPSGTLKEDTIYIHKLDILINNLTAINGRVILDLHNFMLYINDTIVGVIDGCPENARGMCANGLIPGSDAVTTFWSNIARRYQSPFIIYNVMNEIGPNATLNDVMRYTTDALKGIRTTETALNLSSHLVLISGTQSNRMQDWFLKDRDGASNDNNSLFLDHFRNDSNFAVAVHHYFDPNKNGLYPVGDCTPEFLFRSLFNQYFRRFMDWIKSNNVRFFITEFGAPDTPDCHADVAYFLTQLEAQSDSGPLGWLVWASDTADRAGVSTDLNPFRRELLSLHAGHASNSMLSLYNQFLTSTSSILPPLIVTRIVLQIYNDIELAFGNTRITYVDGYLAPQFHGVDVVSAGELLNFWTNYTLTPINTLRTRYVLPDGSFLVIVDNGDRVEPQVKDSGCFTTVFTTSTFLCTFHPCYRLVVYNPHCFPDDD